MAEERAPHSQSDAQPSSPTGGTTVRVHLGVIGPAAIHPPQVGGAIEDADGSRVLFDGWLELLAILEGIVLRCPEGSEPSPEEEDLR
jgi:hypothetical protein